MTDSIAPAKTPLELATQKRRYAFVRLFDLLRPEIGLANRAEAIDGAIDEFLASHCAILQLTAEPSTTPVYDYLQEAQKLRKLRAYGELTPDYEEQATVRMYDLRQLMSPEQQRTLSEELPPEWGFKM